MHQGEDTSCYWVCGWTPWKGGQSPCMGYLGRYQTVWMRIRVRLLACPLWYVVCMHLMSHPPEFQLIASPDAGDTCLSQKRMSSYSGIDADNQPPVLWMHKEFNLCHISKNPIYLKTGSSFNCYWISFLAHIGTLTHAVRGTAVSDTLKHP